MVRKAVYQDPTGSGDDMTVEMPSWAQAPARIVLFDNDGERYAFELDEEEVVE